MTPEAQQHELDFTKHVIGTPSQATIGDVPFIIAGVRQSLALGLIGIIVGELHASSDGLGHLLVAWAQDIHTDKVFAIVVILAAAGPASTS